MQWIERRIKWIFTLPAVVFVSIMMVFPVGFTIYLSFTEWQMSNISLPVWVYFKNYISLFSDKDFRHALFLTFYFTVVAVALETVLGVALALLLNAPFKGKGLVKTLFLLPMVATPVAVGLVWVLIYEPSIGIANIFLKALGFPPQAWLASPQLVIPSLVVVDVWEWTPMIALIVLAGLVTLPKEPYEAAIVDGANRRQVFWNITLPLLKPTIYAVVLIRTIDALKTFDIIYATTQGGPGTASQTLNIYGYVLGFQYYNMGLASALLVIFFAIVVTVSILFVRLGRKAGNVL